MRTIGEKIDEPRHSGLTRTLDQSSAHSAPVYLTVEGGPPLSSSPRAKDVARRWLARMEDLEARLAEDKITHLADRLAKVPQDVAWEDVLRRNRLALIEEIETARRYFAQL